MFIAETQLGVGELLAILAAIGGLGGVATLFLAPRQGRSIAVQASEAAVRALNSSMETLRTDLARAHRELEKAQRELDEARGEREDLLDQVGALQTRVRELEERLDWAKTYIDKGQLPPPYQGPDRRKEDDPAYKGPERRTVKKRSPRRRKGDTP